MTVSWNRCVCTGALEEDCWFIELFLFSCDDWNAIFLRRHISAFGHKRWFGVLKQNGRLSVV